MRTFIKQLCYVHMVTFFSPVNLPLKVFKVLSADLQSVFNHFLLIITVNKV